MINFIAREDVMKEDISRIFLQILLLLSVFSLCLPASTSESSSVSESYVAGEEITISPGDTTIHFVHLALGEESFYQLFNVTISEPGWYRLEIWIDMFNPSDELWGIIEYVSENKTCGFFRMGMVHASVLPWPWHMIDLFGENLSGMMSTWTWGHQGPLCLSAHEYRENAFFIIAEFEFVKTGIIEYSLMDSSEFWLNMWEEHLTEELTDVEVRVLDEDEAAELPRFPEPPQPPDQFDIVVYASETPT